MTVTTSSGKGSGPVRVRVRVGDAYIPHSTYSWRVQDTHNRLSDIPCSEGGHFTFISQKENDTYVFFEGMTIDVHSRVTVTQKDMAYIEVYVGNDKLISRAFRSGKTSEQFLLKKRKICHISLISSEDDGSGSDSSGSEDDSDSSGSEDDGGSSSSEEDDNSKEEDSGEIHQLKKKIATLQAKLSAAMEHIHRLNEDV